MTFSITSGCNDKRKAMMLMALCGVMWSLGGIFIKLISWNPLLIAGIRSIIAALILGGYMYFKKVPVNICRYSIGAGLGGKDDSVRMTGILIAHCLTSVIGTPIGLMETTSVAGAEILYIIIPGVFQLGIPYVLFTIATRDCPPLAASLIAMLEPLLNPVWVAIFVGEMPGICALAGAAVIITAVTWWCISDSRAPANPPAIH